MKKSNHLDMLLKSGGGHVPSEANFEFLPKFLKISCILTEKFQNFLRKVINSCPFFSVFRFSLVFSLSNSKTLLHLKYFDR